MGSKKTDNQKNDIESKTTDSMQLIENAKYSYDQVNGWINNADNKVSVSCGVFTGVFGVISFLAERFTGSTIINECWHCVHRGSFILSFIALGISIFAYVLAINPNLGSNEMKSEDGQPSKKYPIYFGDISDIKNGAEYITVIKSASNNDFLNELLFETYHNSGICARKMQRYRFGLWSSCASVVFAVLSCVAKFLMYR